MVWPKPVPIPSATHFASLNDVAAVPYLNEKGREGYKKFLTLQKPRAFVIAPDGGWHFAYRGYDPLAVALESCRKKHTGCSLYAVDDQIVWPETLPANSHN